MQSDNKVGIAITQFLFVKNSANFITFVGFINMHQRTPVVVVTIFSLIVVSDKCVLALSM